MKKRYHVENSHKKRPKKPEYVIDCLHLPKDVVMGMELISLTGNREMNIRHFKGLIAYSDCEICLRAATHRLHICGDCLTMKYFTAEEVKIQGYIRQITFEEGAR